MAISKYRRGRLALILLIGMGSVALLLVYMSTRGVSSDSSVGGSEMTASTDSLKSMPLNSTESSGDEKSNNQNTNSITAPQNSAGMNPQTIQSIPQGQQSVPTFPRKYNCTIQITELSDHPTATTAVVQVEVNVQESDIHFAFMKLRAGDYKKYFAINLRENGIGVTQLMVPIDTAVQVSGYAASDYRQDSYMCEAST